MTSSPLPCRDDQTLLERIENYYDTVPRRDASVEVFGSLTLFVRRGRGWSFYARPALGWSGRAATAADVVLVRERQRELGVPESLEWIAEVTPGLRAAVEAAGLAVHEHPLMVLDAGLPAAPAQVPVRILGPDDPALPSASAVPQLAFAEPGTGIGTADRGELASAVQNLADDTVPALAGRVRTGATVVAVALDGDTALCAGQHQPLGPVSEIVGVGTLPAARRQGLALAVTATLVADARDRGVELLFLSAGDDDVARLYGRLGFRRVATALIAEPR